MFQFSANSATYLAVGLILIVLTLVVCLGLVMYAYYHECDPLLVRKISKGDQVRNAVSTESHQLQEHLPMNNLLCKYTYHTVFEMKGEAAFIRHLVTGPFQGKTKSMQELYSVKQYILIIK